jgi:hypothetical protein
MSGKKEITHINLIGGSGVLGKATVSRKKKSAMAKGKGAPTPEPKTKTSKRKTARTTSGRPPRRP